MIQKEIGFEFIEVGNLEPPTGNASKQSPQHDFIKVRRSGKDDVPEIDLAILQRDSKYAGIRGVILVIADDSRHRLFVDSNPPDFNSLANTQVAIHNDRGALVTDVNRLPLAGKSFTAFRRS